MSDRVEIHLLSHIYKIWKRSKTHVMGKLFAFPSFPIWYIYITILHHHLHLSFQGRCLLLTFKKWLIITVTIVALAYWFFYFWLIREWVLQYVQIEKKIKFLIFASYTVHLHVVSMHFIMYNDFVEFFMAISKQSFKEISCNLFFTNSFLNF